MVVVVMEEACEDPRTWDGSVGIGVGSHLHYSFKTNEELESCVNELHEEIRVRKARLLGHDIQDPW